MNSKTYQDHEIKRIVLFWLALGLLMIYLQIVIGGITRLTGSGLSITEWEIITGSLPPLTDESWILEFEKYKETPQYTKINKEMKMGSIFTPGTFKFIYFWEYLHRLWARIMGLVFIIPFIFFYVKRWLPGKLIKGLGLVIALAALAATFGWIMVASGLVNRPWVNAYKLAFHLCIGISVFMALWWAFIKYVHSDYIRAKSGVGKMLQVFGTLLVIQIFLGGVMSGTKAALFINTWPDMNGAFIPEIILDKENWSANNFNNYEQSGFLVSLIQLFHRSLAYFIAFFSVWYGFRNKLWTTQTRTSTSYLFFIGFLIAQVIVGILTLINSIGIIPVFWGVLHQGVAVLLFASFLLHIYYRIYVPHKA